MASMRWTPVLLALGACGDPKSTPDATTITPGDIGRDEALIDQHMPDPNMPATLAETGLCVDAGCTQIASGIHAYKPRWELWSDTATKRRWIYLPPGSKIDTSNMDHWSFPVGTKLWKEFTRGTTRVETRLVMRVDDTGTNDDWFYAAYVWNQAQNATVWAEFGEPDANGTEHDVPGKVLCSLCHDNNRPSRVLGFSALQLDFDGANGELDLADVIANNWLTQNPAGSTPYFPLPGNTTTEQPALGYMHANCGHCHNPNSSVNTNTPIALRLTTTTLGSLATTPPYATTVNVEATLTQGVTIVEPGMPDASDLIQRFESTNIAKRMPQAGTEMMDTTGQTILRDWVTNIPQ